MLLPAPPRIRRGNRGPLRNQRTSTATRDVVGGRVVVNSPGLANRIVPECNWQPHRAAGQLFGARGNQNFSLRASSSVFLLPHFGQESRWSCRNSANVTRFRKMIGIENIQRGTRKRDQRIRWQLNCSIRRKCATSPEALWLAPAQYSAPPFRPQS